MAPLMSLPKCSSTSTSPCPVNYRGGATQLLRLVLCDVLHSLNHFELEQGPSTVVAGGLRLPAAAHSQHSPVALSAWIGARAHP